MMRKSGVLAGLVLLLSALAGGCGAPNATDRSAAYLESGAPHNILPNGQRDTMGETGIFGNGNGIRRNVMLESKVQQVDGAQHATVMVSGSKAFVVFNPAYGPTGGGASNGAVQEFGATGVRTGGNTYSTNQPNTSTTGTTYILGSAPFQHKVADVIQRANPSITSVYFVNRVR